MCVWFGLCLNDISDIYDMYIYIYDICDDISVISIHLLMTHFIKQPVR